MKCDGASSKTFSSTKLRKSVLSRQVHCEARILRAFFPFPATSLAPSVNTFWCRQTEMTNPGWGCQFLQLLWIASPIRRYGLDTTYFVALCLGLSPGGPLLCLSRDIYACIILFMRIALCVLSLTRALLQIHYGFMTIMCLRP